MPGRLNQTLTAGVLLISERPQTGAKRLSSRQNCKKKRSIWTLQERRHLQKHLLSRLQGTGIPPGEAGHKGVLPVRALALLPPASHARRLILQGESPAPRPCAALCSPPPLPRQGSAGQEADRREFSVYNDFLENFLSRQAAPGHT